MSPWRSEHNVETKGNHLETWRREVSQGLQLPNILCSTHRYGLHRCLERTPTNRKYDTENHRDLHRQWLDSQTWKPVELFTRGNIPSRCFDQLDSKPWFTSVLQWRCLDATHDKIAKTQPIGVQSATLRTVSKAQHELPQRFRSKIWHTPLPHLSLRHHPPSRRNTLSVEYYSKNLHVLLAFIEKPLGSWEDWLVHT